MESVDYFVLTFSIADRLSLALIYALVLSVLWLAPTVSRHDNHRQNYLFWLSLNVLLLTTIQALFSRTAAMADVSLIDAWTYIPRVLTASDYGTFWMLRIGLWLVMLVCALLMQHKSETRLPAIILLIAALGTTSLQSVTGHAGDDGFVSTTNLLNSLHLLSISLWGGAVIVYALSILPTLRTLNDARQTASAAQRLSVMATFALMLVLITGLFNTWRQLDNISDLWTSDYGQLLLIKLVFVSVMMTIGASNKFIWVPRLVTQAKQASLNNNPTKIFLGILRIDSLVFLTTMVIATILAATTPPSHMS